MREIVLDTETTGLNVNEGHRLIEIGACEMINHVLTNKTFHVYINPEREIDIDAVNIHPKIKAIGLDFVQNMVDYGNVKIKDQNLKDRVVLKWGDATDIDYDDNTFDVTAMAFGIRNIPDKVKALTEMKRVVLPEGQILILELTTPNPGFFKDIYSFYLNNE